MYMFIYLLFVLMLFSDKGNYILIDSLKSFKILKNTSFSSNPTLSSTTILFWYWLSQTNTTYDMIK